MSEQDRKYPHVIEFQGEVMTLLRETRWHRVFISADGRRQLNRSRLQDGSAAVTLEALTAEWDHWSHNERKDFCDSIQWLPHESRPNIMRFLIKKADPRTLSNNALALTDLPRAEILPWLVQTVAQSPAGAAINYVQALAWLGGKEALDAVSQRFASIWNHPDIWVDHQFVNWIAVEAIHCIRHLIESGEPASAYREHAASLAEHASVTVRQTYDSLLAEYF